MSAAQATHAASAGYSISATWAASAGYAASAAQATHAASANYSTSAAQATHSASAGYATSAAQATNAASAGFSVTANYSVLNGIEYIVGTQTAATGTWTGVTTSASLYAGKTIAYKLPFAGSGNASLVLELTGEVQIIGIVIVEMQDMVLLLYHRVQQKLLLQLIQPHQPQKLIMKKLHQLLVINGFSLLELIVELLVLMY